MVFDPIFSMRMDITILSVYAGDQIRKDDE